MSETSNLPFSGRDRLACLLLSTNNAENLFSHTNQRWLFELLRGHGIPVVNMTSLEDSKKALLTHFLYGACGQLPDSSQLPECQSIRHDFANSREMAYFALSLLISAPTRLSGFTLKIIGSVLGNGGEQGSDLDAFSSFIQSELINRRNTLVEEFSETHPSQQVLEGIDRLPLSSLISLAALHGIPSKNCSAKTLSNTITTHLVSGACGSQKSNLMSIGCQSVVRQMFKAPVSDSMTQEEFQQMLQIRLLTQLQPRLSKSVARRILSMHNVEYSVDDGPAKLRSQVGKYIKSLNGKRPCYQSRQTKRDAETESRVRQSEKLKAEWPQLISPGLKEKFKKQFNALISKDALSTFTCGSCVERCNMKQRTTISFEEFDLKLLKSPDEPCNSASESEDPDLESEKAKLPWLDPEMIPPPMPVDSGQYDSLLIDPQCIENDLDSMEPVLVVCKGCKSALKSGKVPRLSMANYNYLGPIPPELRDLSVVVGPVWATKLRGARREQLASE
ncbi:hypothetical protein R3P38DRAFT_3513871 [Favolaschia claudopus]|uniref:Uncharacterized protein n=1 Tax=Favolaschia claudopus TaxID=2862362 RepID=A0AAW0BT17_9AGAR